MPGLHGLELFGDTFAAELRDDYAKATHVKNAFFVKALQGEKPILPEVRVPIFLVVDPVLPPWEPVLADTAHPDLHRLNDCFQLNRR